MRNILKEESTRKRLAQCNHCQAKVYSQKSYCPLCGQGLFSLAERAEKDSPPPIPYPDLSRVKKSYNIFLRVWLFVTLLILGSSFLLNLLVFRESPWSLILLVIAVYVWLMLLSLLRRGVNQAKRLTLHVSVTSLLFFFMDYLTGYEGWSLSYAMPILFMGGIIGILVMSIFLHARWQDYVFYQVLMGLFGFIPLILYFSGIAKSLLMVILVSSLGLASILFTLIFADRSLKEDFVRRFHL